MSSVTQSAGGLATSAQLGMITGFTNYSMQEHQAFYKMKAKIEELYVRHGFSAFTPRPVERLDNLFLKGGIGKQIYTLGLRDGTDKDIGLPFDRTVSLALFIAEKFHSLIFPLKRFDVSYSFRGEHAQAGRFRGFFQADIDVIGNALKIEADVECISTIYDVLSKLQIGDFKINVNHIKLAKNMLTVFGVSQEQLPEALRIIDKMDKVSIEEIQQDLQTLLSDMESFKIAKLVHLYSLTGSIEEFQAAIKEEPVLEEACAAPIEEIKTLMNLLNASGVGMEKIGFSPKMVRGLDYYTGIVFETFLVGKERYGSIASGGRYDNLVDTFLDKASGLEGTGGAIGLTRLFDICLREDLIPLEQRTLANVLIAMRGNNFSEQANQLGFQLRERGINVDLFVGTKKIKKELDYANKKSIPFTVMVMDTNAFVVKNMSNAEQKEFSTIEETVVELERLMREAEAK